MLRPITEKVHSGNGPVSLVLGEGTGGRVPPLTAKTLGKRGEKSGKKRKNWEEKAKYQGGSSTLPLLTDRAGYATAWMPSVKMAIWSLNSGQLR